MEKKNSIRVAIEVNLPLSLNSQKALYCGSFLMKEYGRNKNKDIKIAGLRVT